jgi:hypothetical protein
LKFVVASAAEVSANWSGLAGVDGVRMAAFTSGFAFQSWAGFWGEGRFRS